MTEQNKVIGGGFTFFKDDTILLDVLVGTICPLLIIFGFYIHFCGDYFPGGGFQSGVIFAAVFYLCHFTLISKDANVKIRYNFVKMTNLIAVFAFTFYAGFFLLPLYNGFKQTVFLKQLSVALFEVCISAMIFAACVKIIGVFIAVLKSVVIDVR